MSRVAAFSPRSRAFLERAERGLADATPEAIAASVEALVAEHDSWRARACLATEAGPRVGAP